MQVQRRQSQEEIIQALRRQVDELTEVNRQLREQLALRGQLATNGSATDIGSPYLNTIRWIKAATGFSQERIGRLIGVTRQTINRWEHGEPITDANRRRLFAVRDVLERAMLRYPTPGELATWLDTPEVIDGRTPAELLEADEINKARLLAISTPSPGLAPPPAWVRQPVPEALRAGEEHRQEVLPPSQDDELAALIGDEDEDVEDISTL